MRSFSKKVSKIISIIYSQISHQQNTTHNTVVQDTNYIVSISLIHITTQVGRWFENKSNYTALTLTVECQADHSAGTKWSNVQYLLAFPGSINKSLTEWLILWNSLKNSVFRSHIPNSPLPESRTAQSKNITAKLQKIS